VHSVTVAFTTTNEQINESASMRLPILQILCRRFWKTSHHPGLSAPLQLRFWFLRLLVFPKGKIAVENEDICECDGHTVHKLSQQRLTADWLAPREIDSSRIRSKVSSDWLPSYIKATRTDLDIFKMAGYFPDMLHILAWHLMEYAFCNAIIDGVFMFLSDWRRPVLTTGV